MTTLVKVTAPTLDGDATLLTPEALDFLGMLQGRFDGRRRELLAARQDRQARFDAGVLPDFLPETIAIRTAAWKVAPTPRDLLDRRVEITGPPDRKMVINALNSGASCFMADFEDSTSPTWRNVIDGQLALRDAVNGTLAFTDPASGKHYALGPEPAVLMVRPRGWHLDEAHVQLGGRPVSASLFDFGLYAFHNVASLRRKGTGAYFYLPKLEHHEEARLWDEVMAAAEEALDLPIGSLKVTVLIETLPAAFQLHEILFALQRRVVGLNCGRWDYIFSTIKTLREHVGALLPDRGQVGMTAPFMDAYTRLVVQTCHRRGCHAMGGMAAQIPNRHDPEANAAALEKVRRDKEREVHNGHDGTWVAHPGLVGLAREVFDAHMPGPNQLHRRSTDAITAADLLRMPEGTRTLEGLRHSIQVGVRYLEAWLRGVGCVPLYGLMEDAATAEICRTQVWQWIHHQTALSDGSPVTVGSFRDWLAEELASMLAEPGARDPGRRFEEAGELFGELSTSATLEPFLTLPAYRRLLSTEVLPCP